MKATALFFVVCLQSIYYKEAACLHSNLFHLCPCCNQACLSPRGLFSWCTAATSNSYKSHYIIAASRFALRTALPVRASNWPLKLLGRPLRAGYRSNRKSRLLSRGPVIGGSGFPWTVNHALSCAPRFQRSSLQRAECGATRRAAYQQTHGSRTGLNWRLANGQKRWTDPDTWYQLYLWVYFFPIYFLKYLLFVWEPNIYLLLSALLISGFNSSTTEHKKSSLTLRKGQESETGVFVPSHVEASDYCSRHLFTGSF